MTATDCAHTFRCDAVALDSDHRLLYLSVAGPSTALKALRAVLSQPKEQYKLHTTDYTDAPYPRDYFARDGDGYHSYSTALGLGTWHMVLASKRRGFMPCISEEAVWQEINSTNYTTPLLRDWAKPIYERMRELPRLLKPCQCWGCECGLLDMKDERLDQLVLDLLRQKKITLGGHAVDVPKDLVECGACGGKGKRYRWSGEEVGNCWTCNGMGKLEMCLDGSTRQITAADLPKPKELPPAEPSEQEQITCEECNGEGAIDDDTICHACNGSGTK